MFETPDLSQPSSQPYRRWGDPYDDEEGDARHARYICRQLVRDGHQPSEELLAWASLAAPEPRPRKTSVALSGREVRRLYESVAFANYSGTPMNTFTTIAWSTVGVSADNKVQDARAEFLDRFRHWCDDHDLPFYHVWVLERGKRLGLHIHVLAHIPPAYRTAYGSWALSAVRTISKQEPLRGKMVDGKPPLSTLHIGNRPMDIADQWRAFRYMVKGAGPDEVQKFLGRNYHSMLVSEFADLRCSYQGEVTGARSGRSQTLTDKARWLLFDQLGVPSAWPNTRAPASKLHYGSSFLHEGDMRRQLQCLDI